MNYLHSPLTSVFWQGNAFSSTFRLLLQYDAHRRHDGLVGVANTSRAVITTAHSVILERLIYNNFTHRERDVRVVKADKLCPFQL